MHPQYNENGSKASTTWPRHVANQLAFLLLLSQELSEAEVEVMKLKLKIRKHLNMKKTNMLMLIIGQEKHKTPISMQR